MKTSATTVKADLKLLSGLQVLGYARWRKGWVKVSSELGQDRRSCNAHFRGVVSSIDDASSTRRGECRRKDKYSASSE